MPSRPKPPPEHEIEEAFVKGTGPGGQKINKTNSAVQLKHIPTGLVVKSQATRSRSQNRVIARNLLALKLDEMANGSESRVAAVVAKKVRKRANAAKKSRRKYRKLEEEAAAEVAEKGGDTTTRTAAGVAAAAVGQGAIAAAMADGIVAANASVVEGLTQVEFEEYDEEEDEYEEEEEQEEEEEEEEEEESNEEVWQVEEAEEDITITTGKSR